MREPIPYSRQWIDDQDVAEVEKILRSDYLTQGPTVKLFEEALADRFGVERAVVCSSGTAALHLAYAGLGINGQSTGIVPPITFAASANALLYLGSRVVFCDVNPETGLLCTNSLQKILNELEFDEHSSNVVVPVSFAGSLAPLREIAEISAPKGFEMLEDAAHSPGAWKEASSNGKEWSVNCKHTRAAILSFHPVKHICCGEGGAILTNDKEMADRLTNLRSHGIVRPQARSNTPPWFYEQMELGWNYRLTDLQSALGLSQLARLEKFLEKRRSLAERYRKILSHYPFQDFLSIPPSDPGHAWHLFVIRFNDPVHRDEAHVFLKERGIHTQVHYVPLYRHPYYEQRLGKIRLPGTEKFYERCLSIPLFPKMTDSEQDRVCEGLKEFIESRT